MRDVLERNVTTQLRKITFSALVYGALVVVCLGGVVWGMSYACPNVFPIHWSSNEPVLEFPVDLLFYNFVMPLAIKSIRPSDGLHRMYNWWFHKCARVLRLTNFLFGERRKDEEGYYVCRTWTELVFGAKDTETPILDQDKDRRDIPRTHLVKDGQFVRAPASDQVRIPKGGKVFLEVSENNERVDGKQDQGDGIHGKTNNMFTHVYIPPRFRTRVATFIILIWIFAATTGVGSTIIPLVIGRKMVSPLFPAHVRINDIYAFSAGIYAVGGTVYFGINSRAYFGSLKQRLEPYMASPKKLIPGIYRTLSHFVGLGYMVWAFALLLPSLFALITELYALIPLHTYLGEEQPHVIHFVQDWTLGVLYVRMALRFVMRRSDSRPSIALNAILRNGWLRPDVKLATRAFVVPSTLLTLVAILGPLPIGFVLNHTLFHQASAALHSQVYRYCYPGALLGVLAIWIIYGLQRKIGTLRVSIKDEVYLIGERLHNFSEKGAKDVGATRRMVTE